MKKFRLESQKQTLAKNVYYVNKEFIKYEKVRTLDAIIGAINVDLGILLSRETLLGMIRDSEKAPVDGTFIENTRILVETECQYYKITTGETNVVLVWCEFDSEKKDKQ
jgi:hypothetical protein